DLQVDLPTAARRPKDPKPKINYVTVQDSGKIYLNQAEVTMDELQGKLTDLRFVDPDLNVVIRGSAKTKYGNVVAVMNALQDSLILKVNLATDPAPDGPPSAPK